MVSSLELLHTLWNLQSVPQKSVEVNPADSEQRQVYILCKIRLPNTFLKRSNGSHGYVSILLLNIAYNSSDTRYHTFSLSFFSPCWFLYRDQGTQHFPLILDDPTSSSWLLLQEDCADLPKHGQFTFLLLARKLQEVELMQSG